jgi:hypothetical protein
MFEIAISLTDPVGLWSPAGLRSPGMDSALAPILGETSVTRLYLGNEFCENLMLSPERLRKALRRAAELGLRGSLLTPMVTDRGLRRLLPLLEVLAPGAEVIVNDWGALRLLRESFPHLVPVAGRLFAKQIKDPRLSSPDWMRLAPHGLFESGFRDLLLSFGVGRMEFDLPPHLDPSHVHSEDIRITAHAPYGYCSKGRICRIGSLSLPKSSKFAPGHPCRQECLTYVAPMERRVGAGESLHVFQRGNTLFYRYSEAMMRALGQLLRERRCDRVVVSGDWNEDCRAA